MLCYPEYTAREQNLLKQYSNKLRDPIIFFHLLIGIESVEKRLIMKVLKCGGLKAKFCV